METETKILIAAIAVLVPAILALIRLIYVLPACRLCHTSSSDKKLVDTHESPEVMVLLGSGGHTGEMLRILAPIDLSTCSRTWFVSSGDSTSLHKVKQYEETLNGGGKAAFAELKRARKVGELLVSSFFSTLRSLVSTITQLWNLPKPDVLLLNGPGTSVPLAYVLFAMKLFGLCNTRIVYIESLARVKALSLSGKLILPIADRFLVQWKPLAEKYHRAEYYGILI